MARARAPSPTMIKVTQPSIGQLLVGWLLGALVCTYVGFLFGAAWVPGQDFSEWMDSFNQFVLVEHHLLVGATNLTPKLVALFVFAWTLGYLFIQTQIKHPFQGREHGNAKWGNAKTFTSIYADHDKSHEIEVNFGDVKYDGVFTVNTHNYWLAEGVYVSIDNKFTSNLNILIVGPPGTGKSFRVVRPILSQLCGNFLVTDPKGELSMQTGQFMYDNDYETLIFNVESEEGMETSIRFNPFRYLRCESDIMSLAQILFQATSDPNDSADAFFEQSAEVLMTDILYLMHYTYSPERKTWENFVELLESTAVKADPKTRGIDRSDEKGIYNRFKQANDNWHNGVYTNGVPQKNHLKGWVDIEKFYTGAQETTSSIVASLDAHCRYMKLDCVKKLLSEDDIRIGETFGYCRKNPGDAMGSQKAILYIVTSETKRYFDWITSMIYSLFFEELYHITKIDPAFHESLPHHLTFMMDEFNNITLPESFVDKLSTMRSRNMSATVIVQNLKQIKNKYPDNEMDEAFIGYMSFIAILGAPDKGSCEYMEPMFGNMTINKKTTGLSRGGQGSSSENEDRMEKPLFSAYDMQSMTKDGPLAMIVKGSDPLYEQKVKFENSPLLPLLTRRTPYVCVRKESDVPVFDPNAPACDQIPDCEFGSSAETALKQYKEQGVQVKMFTDDEIDAYNVVARHQPLEDIKLTSDMAETIQKNAERIKKEEFESSLDWDLYSGNQMLMVQRLKNAGYDNQQIKALTPLILDGKTFEEITVYFGNQMTVKDITDFVERLVNLQKERNGKEHG